MYYCFTNDSTVKLLWLLYTVLADHKQVYPLPSIKTLIWSYLHVFFSFQFLAKKDCVVVWRRDISFSFLLVLDNFKVPLPQVPELMFAPYRHESREGQASYLGPTLARCKATDVAQHLLFFDLAFRQRFQCFSASHRLKRTHPTSDLVLLL